MCTNATTLYRRKNIDLLKLDSGLRSLYGKPSDILSINGNDLGVPLVVELGELRPFDVVSTPPKKLFDNPTLRLEVGGFDKFAVTRYGRS